jgi:hypothetical protein
MLPLPAGREVSPGASAPAYARHRLERSLLYRFVQEYYPAIKAQLKVTGSWYLISPRCRKGRRQMLRAVRDPCPIGRPHDTQSGTTVQRSNAGIAER